MASTRLEKLREASRAVKNPVYGNLDTEKKFPFDRKDQDHYFIVEIPVRTVQVGTQHSTNIFEDLAKTFFLSISDYEEMFEFGQRFKNDSRKVYRILHDPTIKGGKAVVALSKPVTTVTKAT